VVGAGGDQPFLKIMDYDSSEQDKESFLLYNITARQLAFKPVVVVFNVGTDFSEVY
jgi:hypothetical protein